MCAAGDRATWLGVFLGLASCFVNSGLGIASASRVTFQAGIDDVVAAIAPRTALNRSSGSTAA